MKDETSSTDLVTQAPSALPALPDPEALKEIAEANLGGLDPNKQLFEVIKMPTGGAEFWTVPGEEKATPEEQISGVVLDHYPTRAFWRNKPADGATARPDCSSLDAKTGSLPRNEDGEFGACGWGMEDDDPRKCKWAKFGTAVNDSGQPTRGQACQFKHRVFLYMPEKGILPYMLVLSATSATKKYAGSWSTYAVKLMSQLKKVDEVFTKIKLKGGEKNPDGKPYSLATFWRDHDRDLNSADKKTIATLQAMFAAAMRETPIEAAEAEETGTTQNGAPSKPRPWDNEPQV